MIREIRISLLSVAAASLAWPAIASVPYNAEDVAAQMSAGLSNEETYHVERGGFIKIAYHDLKHSQALDDAYGAQAFKRGELRIDRQLNCFMAGSGDLICFSAGLDEKATPSRAFTQEEKAAPKTSNQ